MYLNKIVNILFSNWRIHIAFAYKDGFNTYPSTRPQINPSQLIPQRPLDLAIMHLQYKTVRATKNTIHLEILDHVNNKCLKIKAQY